VVEPKTVDVNALIIDAEKMLRRILGEDIEVHVALAAGAGKVVVDPGLFGQVLLNLGVNARDAMPRGGRFVVQTADVDLAQGDLDDLPAVRPGRYVLVSVADTGVGMAQDVMARVFEPFFTTKGVGRGSGLGLSVVHGIISQSGGHIRLDSERDKGTTFAFYLPAAEDLPPVRRTESDLPARSGDETLLVVEDEDAVRRAARRALSTRGYTVLEASSGEGALDVLRERGGEVDLLFTDVVMPRMDGRQLADAVRARYPNVRVLFTSGYTDDAVTRHGIETGEVAFVQKPYTIEALLRRVRAMLDHP
jgi:CheY-like chemotaxis protein